MQRFSFLFRLGTPRAYEQSGLQLDHQVSRASDIFRRLRDDGAGALDALCKDVESENLFLDFKTEPQQKDLDAKLGKCISGFANSAGGVIVWGVECRKDAQGNEVATPRGLADAARFLQELSSRVSRVTLPVQPNIQFALIEKDSLQCVAMHVPRAEHGPVQAISSNYCYYLRAGSAFPPVTHDSLANMFGRTPAPVLRIHFSRRGINLHQNKLELRFAIIVENLGPVVAKGIFVSMQSTSAIAHISFSEYQDFRGVIYNHEFSNASCMFPEDISIPPGAKYESFVVVVSLLRNSDEGILVTGYIGCGAHMAKSFVLNILARAQDTYRRLECANPGGTHSEAEFVTVS